MDSPVASYAKEVLRLPTPIAVPWARLDTTDDRLTQMSAVLATLEAIHRFLVALVLAEVPAADGDPALSSALQRGTLGSLRELLERSASAEHDPRRPVSARIWRWLRAPTSKLALQRAASLRNDYAHGRIAASDARLVTMLSALRDDVQLLLGSLDWLADYQLVVVERGDLQPDETVTGRVRRYRGPVLPPPLQSLSWRGALPVQQAYLFDIQQGAVLPLAPWLTPIAHDPSGVCNLGLLQQWSPDGIVLSSPLQDATVRVSRAQAPTSLGWRDLLLPTGWLVDATTASAAADVGATPRQSRPDSAPPGAVTRGAPAHWRHAPSAAFGPICPTCGGVRRALRAPFEPATSRFLRCDPCGVVDMLAMPAPASFAAPTSAQLWSAAADPSVLPAHHGPTLIAVSGPIAGTTVEVTSLPLRLGVLGSPDHPRAAVVLVRTLRGAIFAVVAFGDMRLARGGQEAEVLQLDVGDEIEVGRSAYRVLTLGIGAARREGA